MELLVVIAIISVLAGLLLPALQKARTQALIASCVSNDRQQYLYMTMYAGDYDGNFPGSLCNGGDVSRQGVIALKTYVNPTTGAPLAGDQPNAHSFVDYTKNYLKIPLHDNGPTEPQPRKKIANDVLICPSVSLADIWNGGLNGIYGIPPANAHWRGGAITYYISLVGSAVGSNTYAKFLNPGKTWRNASGSNIRLPANNSHIAIVFDRLYNRFDEGGGPGVTNTKLSVQGTHENASNVLTLAGNVVTERRWGKAYPMHPAAVWDKGSGGGIIPNVGYYIADKGGASLILPWETNDSSKGYYDITDAPGIFTSW